MLDPDLLRREPLVYRTPLKRFNLLAPYISVIFWCGVCLLAALVVFQTVRVPLP